MLLLRTITKVILVSLILTAGISAQGQFVPFHGKQVTGTLPGGGNTARDCVNDGGRLVSINVSQKICQFDGDSCPAGWTSMANWSTTITKTCTGPCDPCMTGGHEFANVARESCHYDALGGLCILPIATCSADVVQIGCR